MESVSEKTATLYERLGGEEELITIVDEVLEAHMNNPAISARFLPYLERPEYVEQLKKHTVNFFCAGAGGPQQYEGRDMTTAHRGMNISAGEYMHAIDDIMGVLDKHGKSEETKKDVLAILYSLKGMMIGK
jgi:hemoglobin